MTPSAEEIEPGAPVTSAAPRRGLAVSSSFVFAVSLIVQLIGFVGSFTLAHLVGVTADTIGYLGVAFLYLLVASSINNIADLRLGTAYTYYIARGRPPEHGTGTYTLLRLFLVLIAGVTLGILAPLPGIHLVQNSTQEALFWVYMLLPALWTPQVVYNSLWIAKGDSIRAQYPVLIETVVRTGGLVLVALYISTSWGTVWTHLSSPPPPAVANQVLFGLTAAYVAGAGVATLFCIPSTMRYTGRFLRSEARMFFTFSWPLMGSLLLQFLAGNSIPFVVAAYLHATALAVFLAGNGFRILLMAVPNAVGVPLFPNLAGLHALGDLAEIRRRTWAALRYTALLVVPGLVALVVYRVNFLTVFFRGSYVNIGGHQAGAVCLAILAVSALPAALTQVIQTALNAIGQQRLELYLTALQVAVLFAVAIAFLSRPFSLLGLAFGGLEGAAMAVLASSVAAFGLNTYFLKTRLQVHFDPRPMISITVAAVATFLAVAQLNHLVNPSHWYTLLGLVVFGLVVYCIVLALLGEMTKRDVRILSKALLLPRSITEFMARICRNSGAEAVRG